MNMVFLTDGTEKTVLKVIDQYIIEFFNGLGSWGNLLLIFICLLLSVLLSGVIGFEREFHGHSAGLRTHILVSVGSALIMTLSIYGFGNNYTDGTTILSLSTRDPARLAAQVISGVGFLGAGAIIKNGTDVRGLTTSTTLWLCMAIGLACGSARISYAIIATIISIVTLVSLRKIENLATARRPRIIMVVEQEKPVLRHILLLANEYHVDVKDMQSTVITYKGTPCLRIIVAFQEISRPVAAAFAEDLRTGIEPLEIKVLGQKKN